MLELSAARGPSRAIHAAPRAIASSNAAAGSVYYRPAMTFGCMRSCLLAVLIATAACSPTGPFVWADSLPASASAATDGVVIQEGDTVNVRVFNQEPLSSKERVRTDGKISLPVIGEVTARGKRPAQLASEIQDRLKSVLQAPSVTVTLDAGADLKVSVLGEVKNAGIFQLDHGANVLHALAAAGGLSEYADGDKVFVVRRSLPQRVRFRYQDLRSADRKSIAFTLQAGDVIVVE
jgi:polysaccharide export outer membrane protein